MRSRWRRSMAVVCSAWLASGAAPGAMAYSFNQIVPDVRQPASLSGGSACPVRSHQLTAAGSIALRWSTALGSNPATIVTQNAPGAGQLTEVEQVIQQSLSVWANVSGAALAAASFAADAHGDAERLRRGRSQFDLLRSGGYGLYTRSARVYARGDGGSHRRATREQRGFRRSRRDS